ncbi:LysM peptidoglycan-binding domain-containing protein [Paenibacillus donghaensis]|uniref:3D domain-containing protein n=1 Tax=Paenibacillus donghaensis TaxID=414771 RepID=UPI0018843520|nr:3D domain-containing protein [Paenibacillus donghaensis]MBE9916667.1 LysM peptidoglycan-binding domain-containing protein [Paenibacillus donghaensis]
MKKRFLTAKILTAALGVTLAMQATPIHADSVHVAKDGDTFYTLSKTYGVGLSQLMNANPNIEANNIYAGLKLNVPGQNTVKAYADPAPTLISASLNVDSDQKVVEAWGKSYNYTKKLQVKASAYSSAASENGGWGAVDYFGNPLELGTIAVDPSVIPLGTKVLITGHSFPGLPKKAFVATARDTGGAIKGNRIDIFVSGSAQSVSDFGFQNVELYFIN